MKSSPSFWRRQSTPALVAGITLSAVGVAFNATYGFALGGDNTIRALGMAGVFIACVGLKDWMLGQAVLAVKSGRSGLALACVLGLIIGAAGSFLAAFGSASEGRAEKSDPRQAQITAFKTAETTALEAKARLDELGKVPNVADAKAAIARALSDVDPGIAKRTNGCTVFPTDVGKRVQAVNREACQDVQNALGVSGKAIEAAELRAKREAAQVIIAKGAPKAADQMVANVQAFLSSDVDVAAVLSLIVALIVELGAPVCWTIWQMSEAKPGIPAIPANDYSFPGKPIPGNDPPTRRRGRKSDPKIIQFSERFREKNGRAPSGSEIKMHFPELPTSTAYDYAKRRTA